MTKFISLIIQKLKTIHVLDVVFLTAVLVLAVAFLFVKLHKTTVWIPVTVKVTGSDWWYRPSGPEAWYTSEIKPGLSSYTALGEKIAEVTDVVSAGADENKNFLFVTLSLKVVPDKKKGGYSFLYQPLQVGGTLNLAFGAQNIRGLVTQINATQQQKQLTIEAKLQYIYPWVASQLTEGLQIQDSLGRTIATVKKVRIEPADSFRLADKYNRTLVVSATDPNRSDVTLQLEILVNEVDGTYYYQDGTAIKIGKTIHLEFPRVMYHWAEISDIIDK